jgi:hypothetical protein
LDWWYIISVETRETKQETTMYQVYSYYQGQKWVIASFATEQEALQVSYGYRVNGTETFVAKV